MWPAASFFGLLWLQCAATIIHGESLGLNEAVDLHNVEDAASKDDDRGLDRSRIEYNNPPSARAELQRRSSQKDDETEDVMISNSSLTAVRQFLLGAEIGQDLWDWFAESADQFAAKDHKNLAKTLEIDPVKGKLKESMEKMRAKLDDYLKSTKQSIGFERIPRKGFRSQVSRKYGGVKSALPNPFEVMGAALDFHKALSEDNAVLKREAAVTSLIPVVGCGPEAQIDREKGELNHWDFTACVVGGVLLFTPLKPVGVTMLVIRQIISETTLITETKRGDMRTLWNTTYISEKASNAWDLYCKTAWSEGILSDDFSNASLDLTKAESFALQYAATKELSVLNVGYELLIVGSSSSEEYAAIQLSYGRARTKGFIDLCDMTEARRDELDIYKHEMVMEWLREEATKFKQEFADEYKADGKIVIRDSLARQLRNAQENIGLQRKEAYETNLNLAIDWSMNEWEPEIPAWEKRKTQLPQAFTGFCEKKRSLRKELAGGPAANEVDCRSSDFWTRDGSNLDQLRRGDLRCKLQGKSYGLNHLFFTTCPVGASKTSLACDSKPISVLDPEDYELLSHSGIDEGLVHGGPPGVSRWTAPEVWSEAKEETKERSEGRQTPQVWIQAKPLETINCKAKNISWDFYDLDTIAVAEGKVRCGLPGRPWQSMRWVDGPLVEICQTTQACQLYKPGENLTSDFPKRAAAYGLPAVRPPPPWFSRLIDCSGLQIDWENLQSGGHWMFDPVRRVAEGVDKCGSKEHGTNYWFQWFPRWSDVQYSESRNYSSLVEFTDGVGGDRLDFNGSALYYPTQVKASSVAHMTTPPPEDQNISGKPWHGKRPGTSIICDDDDWDIKSPKQFGDHLRKSLIAKGHVGCGRHGWSDAWHWAEKGKKLVRCRNRFPRDADITCVAWDDFDNLSFDAILGTRATKIPQEPPPSTLTHPFFHDADPQMFIDSDLFEVVTPDSPDGCAKVSDLTYNFQVGSSAGDGTSSRLFIRLGSSSVYHNIVNGPEAGTFVTHTFKEADLGQVFSSSVLDRRGNLYLDKLDFIEIREVGVKSLFDTEWRLQG
ncbi:Heat-labile enterotoxin, A chain [Ophiocordyceps camponoti-floridani]|uniref:Heat-labile enterotoxin, A chain n=1 Tax=Ophiocordyceps camponoti-floridani TaxID=2030778 RepID=A0A8H4Q339_9HYPO|nr:Heat-labile enterotoxin, A chain [Ophiocordyceps camponoti-floridani]